MYIQPNTIHFSPKHSSTRKKARFFIIKFTPIRRIGRNPKQVHSHHEDWRATISYWCDASHQHKRNISVVDARSTRLFRSPADRHNLHVDKLGDKNQNSHQLLCVCLLKSVKYLQFAGVSPHTPKMIHLCAIRQIEPVWNCDKQQYHHETERHAKFTTQIRHQSTAIARVHRKVHPRQLSHSHYMTL